MSLVHIPEQVSYLPSYWNNTEEETWFVKPADFTSAVFSQLFSSEMFPADVARMDIFFYISTTYLRCLQRSSLKTVFSPRCRIPQPQKLYRAQHYDWWSSEWRKEGEQLWGPPGWRWSPSGNTHTQLCTRLAIISCLPTPDKQQGGTSTGGYIVTMCEFLLSFFFYFITFHLTDTQLCKHY